MLAFDLGRDLGRDTLMTEYSVAGEDEPVWMSPRQLALHTSNGGAEAGGEERETSARPRPPPR